MHFLVPFVNLLLGIRNVPQTSADPTRAYSFVLATTALMYLLSGCASAGPRNSGALTISGTISPASAGKNATVTLNGPVTVTAKADSSGNYSFHGLANGTYVVVPSRAGYAFKPGLQEVVLADSNQGSVGFQAAPGHEVRLSWQPSPSPEITGYNVYRGTTDGGPYTRMNAGLLPYCEYVDEAIRSGNSYYYVSTAVDATGIESAFSDQTIAQIP